MMMLLLILCLYPSNLVVTAFHHRNIQKTTIQSQPSLLSQPIRRTTNNNASNYNTKKSLTWSTSPSSSTTLTTSLFAIPIHNIQEGTDFLFSSSSSFVDNSMAMLISSSSSAASPSLFDDIQSMNGSSVGSSSDVLGSIVIWGIRCLSAIITYFSLIYFLDRPRGELYLPVVDNNDNGNGNDGMLQVKQSNVENGGLGLFATQYIIPKGTILGEYPGIVVELEPHISKLNAHPQCEAYIWRFSDNKYVIDPTNSKGILDDICIGGNPNSFLSQWFFTNIINNNNSSNDNSNGNNDSNTKSSIGVPTTLCRINEPPKGYDVNVITTEKTNERKVIFEVERDIYPNEELFIDYGLTYDRSQYTTR